MTIDWQFELIICGLERELMGADGLRINLEGLSEAFKVFLFQASISPLRGLINFLF